MINAKGMEEIAQFLADHHRLGGDRFGASELAAWARDAERQMGEGNGAVIEISASQSITGCAIWHRISPEGVSLQ